MKDWMTWETTPPIVDINLRLHHSYLHIQGTRDISQLPGGGKSQRGLLERALLIAKRAHQENQQPLLQPTNRKQHPKQVHQGKHLLPLPQLTDQHHHLPPENPLLA